MRTSRVSVFALSASLLLFGVGCTAPTSQPGPLDGIEQSVGALNKAKDLAGSFSGQNRKQADMLSNEIPVAMIVTEGSEVPSGAERVSDTSIGCNDRVAYIRVSRETDTGNVPQDALATLFSVKDSNFGGLYNAVWQADLHIDRVSLVGDGLVEANITGETMMGGACDVPRFKAQIEQTVLQYEEDVRILLNGSESAWRCLGDMSGECE